MSTAASTTRPTQHRRSAFTLIEILVVVGIIVLLAGILVPLVGRAMRQAKQTRTAADMQSIGTALEAFKLDHGDYPRVDVANAGAAVLGRYLIGPYGDGTLPSTTNPPPVDGQDPPAYSSASTYLPGDAVRNGTAKADLTYVAVQQTTGNAPSATSVFWAQVPANDGVDGAGLRMRDGGKKWGPYLQEGKFKLRGLAILDGNDNPILYFPARPAKPNIHLPGGYLPPIATAATPPATYDGSLYDTFDNWAAFKHPADANNEPAQWRMHAMLGDRIMGTTAQEGAIVTSSTLGNEAAAYEGPYILWAAGPDGLFGPAEITEGGTAQTAEQNRKAVDNCDDVTNFK